MRTFVAIELDDSCKDRLESIILTLMPTSEGVRWVSRDAMHLTMKFIGELAETDLVAAVSAIEPVTKTAAPFAMSVAALSGFPPRGKPRVIHVDVHEKTGALKSLQEGVDRALAEKLGVAREGRAFVPHITLGRVKRPTGVRTVDEMSETIKDQDCGLVEVTSIVLMKSDLKPQGPIYTPLHTFALVGA